MKSWAGAILLAAAAHAVGCRCTQSREARNEELIQASRKLLESRKMPPGVVHKDVIPSPLAIDHMVHAFPPKGGVKRLFIDLHRKTDPREWDLGFGARVLFFGERTGDCNCNVQTLAYGDEIAETELSCSCSDIATWVVSELLEPRARFLAEGNPETFRNTNVLAKIDQSGA